jgi:hypothetical protein
MAAPGKRRVAGLDGDWERTDERIERRAEVRRSRPHPLLYSPAEEVMSFNDVLEAADQLSLEDQAALIEVLSRRIHERRRDNLVREVQQAERDFEAGLCRRVTPDELIEEILS